MYRWLDHTAELELGIEAASEAEVFADALAAFAELVDDEEDGRERVERVVTLPGSDRATLLVAWLEELLYLAETAGFVPESVAELVLAEDGLRARVRGHVGEPRPLVKAVTYHGLELRRKGDHWRARVVLDV